MVAISGAAGRAQGLNSALNHVRGFGQMAMQDKQFNQNLDQRNKEFDTNVDFKNQEIEAAKKEKALKQFEAVKNQQMDNIKNFANEINIKFGGFDNLQGEAKENAAQTVIVATKALIQNAKQLGIPEANIRATVIEPIQRILNSPTPQQTALAEGEVNATKEVSETKGIAKGLGIDNKTAAQGKGLVPADPQIQKLMETRDELLLQGNSKDAKSVQAQIDALGASATVDPRTLEKTDKTKKEIVDLEVNYKNIVDTGNQVLSLIDEGGEGAVDTAGKVAQGITGITSTLTGLAQNFGVDISKFESGASADERVAKAESILGKASGVSAQIRSALVDLAYAAAAANGQTGKAVSDKDFENNLRQLGSGSGGMKNFKSTLISFLERNQSKFKNKHEALNSLLPSDSRRSMPDVKINSQSTEVVEITTQDQYNKLPSGTIFIENGKRYKKP